MTNSPPALQDPTCSWLSHPRLLSAVFSDSHLAQNLGLKPEPAAGEPAQLLLSCCCPPTFPTATFSARTKAWFT